MSEELIEFAKHSHELTVDMKKSEEDNEPTVPVLVLAFEGAVFPCMMMGVTTGNLKDAAKKSIKHVKETVIPEVEAKEGKKIGKFLWFTISSDTYIQRLSKASEDETYEEASKRRHEGFLGDHFKNGATDVYEALVTVACSPTEQIMITQIYRHTPVDGYEWEDPEIKMTSGQNVDPNWAFDIMDA